MSRRDPGSRLALLSSAAAVLLLAASVAQAGTLRSQNLTALIADSESIVQGTVRTVTDGVDERGVPYTEVTLLVHASAKGSIEDRSEYTFRQFGLLKPRTLENGHVLVAVSPEIFPRWHEGESVVAFLHRPASITGLQTTTGLAQGKLTLHRDRLANSFNNVGLFDGVGVAGDLLSLEERRLLTSTGAVNADAFMSLVRRAVAGRWIETGRMQ